MKYLIDTNIIYYVLNLEIIEGFSYSLDKLPDDCWFLTDLSILESYNKYGDCKDNVCILSNFFSRHHSKIIYLLNSDAKTTSIIDDDFDSTTYSEKLNELRILKKQVEVQALKYMIDLLVICNAERRISEESLDNISEKIMKNLNGLIQFECGKFISELIQRHIDNFYTDDDESKFKTEIQSIMLIQLSLSELIILSSKKDVSTSELLSGVSDGTINVDGDSSVAAFVKLKELLINKEKRKKKWVKGKQQLLKSLSLFDAAPQHYNEIPLGFMKYLKELMIKILTEGKKIHKNDMIDALFFKLYPDYSIITEDLAFSNTVLLIDPKLYSYGKNALQIIKTKIP